MMTKNFGTKVFSALMILALLLVAVPSMTSATAQDQDDEVTEYVPGELIVGYVTDSKDETLKAEGVTALSAQVGAQVVDAAIDQSFFLFRFNTDEEAQNAMGLLEQQPGVAYVERNQVYTIPSIPVDTNGEVQPSYVPSDPSKYREWHLDKILYYQTGTPETGNVPCIVIIDSGVDYNHKDLKGKVFKGKDVIDNDMLPMDLHGHGTHAAGVAAAKTNNAIGIAGVSPRSNILAVRVLDATGTGTAMQVAQGIQWANTAGAAQCGGQMPKIYNLSLGFATKSNAITLQVNAAAAKGRLVVAAAGDNNSTAKVWPGAEPKAFGVAATEQNDRRTRHSNYDTKVNPWVDIAAPGFYIFSTTRVNAYDYQDYSTSAATAIISGAAARVWAKYPQFTLTQLRSRLQTTGSITQGFLRAIKRVDLYKALGGTKLALQGQIFDAMKVEPVKGGRVVVQNAATKVNICVLYTKDNGFYTCMVSKDTSFSVKVTKTDLLAQTKTFRVKKVSKLNSHITLARKVSAVDTWQINIQWQGWQPYQSPGRELDLWLVKPATSKCYAAWSGNDNNLNIVTGAESQNLGQTEGIMVKKTEGGVMEAWVGMWDGSSAPWVNSRITGSGLEALVYYNNILVQRIPVPLTPTTMTSDNWYIGQIDLDAGTWTKVNQIKDDTAIPICMTIN
jgi:thermitase